VGRLIERELLGADSPHGSSAIVLSDLEENSVLE